MEGTSSEVGEFLGQFISSRSEEMVQLALTTLCNRKAIINISVKHTPPPEPVIFKIQAPSPYVDHSPRPYVPLSQMQFNERQQPQMQYGGGQQIPFQPNIQAAEPNCSVDRNAIKDRLLKDGVPVVDALRMSSMFSTYNEAREKYRNERPI